MIQLFPAASLLPRRADKKPRKIHSQCQNKVGIGRECNGANTRRWEGDIRHCNLRSGGISFLANPHLRDKSRMRRLHASLMILAITIEIGETNPWNAKNKGRRRLYKKVNTKNIGHVVLRETNLHQQYLLHWQVVIFPRGGIIYLSWITCTTTRELIYLFRFTSLSNYILRCRGLLSIRV